MSVKEGFLYVEIFQLVGVLWMVTSRKLIWLLDSVSAVNFMFGWIVLKSFCMLFMCVDGVVDYQYVIYVSHCVFWFDERKLATKIFTFM